MEYLHIYGRNQFQFALILSRSSIILIYFTLHTYVLVCTYIPTCSRVKKLSGQKVNIILLSVYRRSKKTAFKNEEECSFQFKQLSRNLKEMKMNKYIDL